MHSAWFWQSKEWAEYQQAYHHGQVPDAYKTSPLADDHDFDSNPLWAIEYDLSLHRTIVLDLTQTREQLWQGVRKSYHSIIHRGEEQYVIIESDVIASYAWVHAEANGGTPPRPAATYECQDRWLGDGQGMLVEAWLDGRIIAAAYWIVYDGGACYMSGPSLKKNVQHAVIWKSIDLLKAKGITLVELGQIDGETEKERNIGKFKSGWGGTVQPFTIARRRVA